MMRKESSTCRAAVNSRAGRGSAFRSRASKHQTASICIGECTLERESELAAPLLRTPARALTARTWSTSLRDELSFVHC